MIDRHEKGLELFFVGTVGGFERPLVEQAGLPFVSYDEVWAGPLHGVNPLRMIGSLAKLVIGVVQAVILLWRRKAQVLLLTGGWVSIPVAMAAWLLRVPVVVYLPDIEPGLTIRVLRVFARRVAITAPESASFFRPGQTVVTGYPLRKSLLSATRKQALEHFGLDTERKTLLVFGGSRGARSINLALGEILPDLLSNGLQIIHISGELDWPSVESRRQALNNNHYHAYPYLYQMGLALAAADLVVCRAGASTLGELPAFGVPSILVPYPYAWRYQKVNAAYLADRGAAIFMEDDRMTDDLLPTIRALLIDDEALARMRAAASALAQPEGARRLAQTIIELVRG